MIMTTIEIKEVTDNTKNVASNTQENRRGSNRLWAVSLWVAAILVGILGFGIRSRVKAESRLRTATAQMAVPSVSVVRPKPGAPADEIILPGSIQPFISSPIYARTDGYLKKWYFDIGAHVRTGQLLAT